MAFGTYPATDNSAAYFSFGVSTRPGEGIAKPLMWPVLPAGDDRTRTGGNEQLGSDSIAVRIGAVYSFARLMRDSQADQQAIVEILSSFIRLQANREPPPAPGEETRQVPADMRAALRVLDEQPRPLALTVSARFSGSSGPCCSTAWTSRDSI